MVVSGPDQPQSHPFVNPVDQEKEDLARSYTIISYILLAFGVFAFLKGAVRLSEKRTV